MGKKVVVEPPTINIDFPVSGSYISTPLNENGEFEPVTFRGTAKAYIKVVKIEVKIFGDEENGQMETDWTTTNIKILPSSDLKNKQWTFDFDPREYNNWDFENNRLTVARDGPIRMQFRVWDSAAADANDPKKARESVELVYIIKTRPSVIKMATPSNTDIGNPSKISDVQWRGEIRGTVIDRRGLRPGYPQIKIWKATDEEPDDDGPNGYGSLYLTADDANVLGPDGKFGVYSDRTNVRVVNASSFSFKLANFTIDQTADPNGDLRPIRYNVKTEGTQTPEHDFFPPGQVYNFKIRTKDTSSDPLNKMIPTDEGPFIEGFFPPMGFGTPDEDPFQYRGQPVKINIFNANSRPTVEINNDDIAKTVLDARPHIYITEPSSRKIEPPAEKNSDLFRLRLKAGMNEGTIYNTTLAWIHEGTNRSGPLEWQSVVNSETGLDLEPGTDGFQSAYFTFTANAGMKAPNTSKPGNPMEPIFTSSPDPYILIFTIYDTPGTPVQGREYPQYRYVVYLDGESPTVSIRSIRGAFKEPDDPAKFESFYLINKFHYTVNGNIQVVVDRTDDSGIMTYRSDPDGTMGQTPPEDGYPMVKWIVEDTTETNDLSATAGTILEKLIKFKNDPAPENLKFFNDIGETPPDYKSGWVRRPIPGSTTAADRSHHFKINTTAWTDGGYYWLYVIAQDQVQNLGFIAQKIYVDQDTDKPVINVRNLFEENAADEPINSVDKLDVSVGLDGTTRKMSGNWKEGARNNILRNQDIDLNITDDDGVIHKDITIKLTILAPGNDIKDDKTTVEIKAEDVLKSGGIRDRSGLLSQELMAKALYGEDTKESGLRDGMYKLEISAKDDVASKVDIPSEYRSVTRPPTAPITNTPPLIKADTPPTATSIDPNPAVYFFAVSAETPVVEITYPDDNAWGSGEPIPITGTAKSRLNIKSLWITFTPNVVVASSSNPNPQSIPIDISINGKVDPPIGTAEPDDKGYYNYTWTYAPPNQGKEGVIFNPIHTDSRAPAPIFGAEYPTREFSVEAYDRIGNQGVAKRNVQIDTKGPDVTISDFNYGRPPEVLLDADGKQVVPLTNVTYLYGKVSFTVSAADENGLYEVDGKSGIRWWVVDANSTTKIEWGTGYGNNNNPDPGKTPDPMFVYSNPAFTPALSPAQWTGYGHFNKNQERNGSQFTWVIDTRYLQDGGKYRLHVIALDKAGNQSLREIDINNVKTNVTWYEEFTIDWKRDYPTIDANSLDPLNDSVKPKGAAISGTVSDIDMFNPANRDTYVSIRFPTNSTGSPTGWGEWIPIKISATYSAANGGMDPSGAIAYKFKSSEYTSTPAGMSANTYLSRDGIKYYQIRVTDEPDGPSDAQKTEGAKWYGKNPDEFMRTDPAYPGYNYLKHDKVSRIFPLEAKAKPADPDWYTFIVDDTYPEIFFDKWDPTESSGTPPEKHPGYSEARPTFSNVDLLIAALTGYVKEYKLSDFSISYSGKVGTETKTFRKLIINNLTDPKDPDEPGKYVWKLEDVLSPTDKSNPTDKNGIKDIFDAAEQGMQIITFEATDMVPLTRRVSYVFAKDTQGPAINFNSIGRAIKQLTGDEIPAYPGTGDKTWPSTWPSDWRYSGSAWRAAWNATWQGLIKNWPAEYAFVAGATIADKADTIRKALKADYEREVSTVIGDPQAKFGQPGYSAPVIEGTFSDLYSSIKILVPANATTYFYYRFKNKNGDLLTIPAGKEVTPQGVPDGITPPQPGVTGNWMRKSIETLGSDGKPIVQNEKEANWKIMLNDADGFTGTDGENLLDIWIADTAGNISDIYNVRFLLDRTAPVLGKEPNPEDPDNPGQKLTDAGEFIITNIVGYKATPAWTPKALPEMQRVFSAIGGSGGVDAEAFTLTGTVSDYNFSGLTITIGQEGSSTYTVTSTAIIDPTKAGPGTGQEGTSKDSDNSTTSRLTISNYNNSSGFEGAPEWTWALQIRNKDISGLRTAAGTANQDSARRYIRVTATDKAGKRVGPVDWFFYLDTKKPTLEYTNLNTGTLSKASSFEDNKLSLTGLVEDDTRIKDVQFMIGRWDYSIPGGDGTNKWTWWNGTAWTTTRPAVATWPSAFNDTKDAGGNITAYNPTRQTSMNWSINQALLDAVNKVKPNTFQANLFNNEGYYRLDLYITDFSLGDGNPHDTYEATDIFMDERFVQVPGSPPPPTDTSLRRRSGRVFYIDKEDPALRWGWFKRDNGQWEAETNDPYNPNNTTYFRNDGGQAKLSFTVGDGNTIQSWEVKVVDNETQKTTLVASNTSLIWEAGSPGTTITSTGPIPIPSKAIPATDANKLSTIDIEPQKLIVAPFMTSDGKADATPNNAKALDVVLEKLPTYTITITVKDGAGRTSSISKQFTLDNTPPRYIQNNFSPTSFEFGSAAAPHADQPVSAPGYTPVITTRSYSYDAVTGRMNIRGSTTDNSNQIRRVAYYVVNENDNPGLFTPTSTVNFPSPADITADKWRYSGGTGSNSPIIASGTTTLMEIDQGTFAWRIMVPKTSMFISDDNAKKYAQKTTTGGTGINGGSNPAGKYRDFSINYQPGTFTTTFTTTNRDVPGLTFPSLPDKTIYGGEDVALITVYVRAEDMAGNVAYEVLKYWIWPEGDRPVVTAINTPDASKPEAERLLNGTIRLSGMAKDNERVKNVWFRVYPAKNNEIYPANADPYVLTIPVWDKDWNATSENQKAVSDDTGDGTLPQFNRTGRNGFLGSRRNNDPSTTVERIGGGWYMANGGNSPEVSWYAYINTNGELDPKNGEDKKEFLVQVRAQDVTYDDKEDKWMDYTPTWRGMASISKGTNAFVVADLPTFNDPRIATVKSETAEAANPKLWEKLDDIRIRNRSSYKVTVTHELGISAIRWSPTLWDKALNSGNGAFQANPSVDSFNLVSLASGQSVYLNPDGKGYTTGTTATADSLLTSATVTGPADKPTGTTGTAMALRVVASKPIAGTTNPVTGTTYFQQYDVFVDLRADVLLARMIADDSAYGDGSTGRAGQVKNSVRYPLYLSASDISKATPLTARGDALLPIDNLDPYGMYTLNRKPAGTAVTIGGEAGDDGPVNGIARVVLWFQRQGGSTDYVSWHHQGTPKIPEASLPPADPIFKTNNNDGPAWWNSIGVLPAAGGVIPAGVSKPFIPNTPNGGTTDKGDYAIVIDTNSPSTKVKRWGHELAMGFADGGIGKLWYVEINSFGIESGPVNLHYVIIDKAGNAKYYKERLIIMNNVAVIDRIKLGTDIRHSMSETGNTGSLTAEKIDDKVPLVATQWPELRAIRSAVPLGGVANDIKDDVKKGISDWIYSSSMGANKIIDFNVRNNLFALRVETTKPPVDKARTFRVEYITGADLYSDKNAANSNRRLTDMKAGKIYMINDPGTAKWGAIGADGDGPWPRGYAFIAAVNGREDNQDKIMGTGSVWELATAAASTIPTTPPTTGTTSRAVSAEFRYGSSAFGAGAGLIRNYVHKTDAVPDAVFPPPDTADWPSTSWNPDNCSLFILRVFDGPENDYFGDFTIIRVRVNNDDNTKPFAQLYDLNPKTEGVDRQNIAQVGNSTANELTRSISPMFIGEGKDSNRTKGGLWNNDVKNVVGIERIGHIEPRQISGNAAPYNTPITISTGVTTTQQHSLTSVEMGGAAPAKATLMNPFADPRGFFTADTVSGKVVLRGYAEDDQRIQRVDLSLGGQTVNILTFQASSGTPGQAGYGTLGSTDSSSANYSPPRTGLLSAANANVYFTDSIDAYRHRVEWAYVWDTETVPTGTVVGDITVQVTAYNRSGTTNTGKTASDTMNAATASGNNARKVHSDASLANRPNTTPYNPGFPTGHYEYNQITVNLRPYITGFLRNQTSFSHNNRSRQGRYMFYRGETAVVTGFNLSTGTLRINTTDLTTGNVPAGELANYGITTANNNHYRQIEVGTGQTTGNGVVRYVVGTDRYSVNTGTAAENNSGANRRITTTPSIRPSYIQPWNIEYSPGVDGSQLWDDFTQVHIWWSGNNNGNDQGVFPKGNNLEVFDPAMSIDPDSGTLWSSHNEGGGGGTSGGTGGAFNTGSTKVGNNSGQGSYVSASFIDPIINSDIYISPRRSGSGTNENSANGGNAFTVWTTYSIIGRSGSTGSWKDYGGVYVSGPQGANPGLSSGAGLAGTSNNGFGETYTARSQYLVESTGFNAGTNTDTNVNWPPGNVDFNAPARNQFKNPHIVTWYGRGTANGDTGTDVEHIHVAYYDTKDGSMKYRYNRRGWPGAMAATADIGQQANNTTLTNSLARNVVPLAWTNLDGGYDYDDTAPFNNNSQGWTSDRNNDLNNNGDGYGANGGNYTTPFSNFTAALAKNERVLNRGSTTLRSTDAGEYNSIAVTSQGYPVIAYYDKANQKLKMAISNATVPIAASRWTIVQDVIPTTNSNAYGTGLYVSLMIDKNVTTNNVHIAAMNAANKNLVYVNGTLTTAGVYTTTSVQVVDSVGSVGRWCNLSLDNQGNPWIGYQDESYQGSRDGIKLAYKNTNTFYKGRVTYSGEDKDLYGADVNGWEAMHIPTQFRVENARVGMECYPTRNNGGSANKIWSGAVGFLGQDLYRAVFYVR
jgi:hypothetical protein